MYKNENKKKLDDPSHHCCLVLFIAEVGRFFKENSETWSLFRFLFFILVTTRFSDVIADKLIVT